MSRFVERLEKISQGGTGGLGFGAAKAGKTPALALVGHISKNYAAGLAAVAKLGLDAALLSGIDAPAGLKKLKKSLPSMPWGVHVTSLSEEDSQAFREEGCDLLAFSLEETTAAAVATDEAARILYTDAGLEDRELRGIASLPLDVFVLRVPGLADAWTLKDLASVAMVSRRVDKYILVEVSKAPTAKDLEALRDAGVDGLVVDMESIGAEALAELKAATLDLPKQKPGRRGGLAAVVPSSVFPSGSAAEPEPDEEDDDFDDE